MTDFLARAWTDSVRPGRDPMLVQDAAESSDGSMDDAAIVAKLAALAPVQARDHVSRTYAQFLQEVQAYRVAHP